MEFKVRRMPLGGSGPLELLSSSIFKFCANCFLAAGLAELLPDEGREMDPPVAEPPPPPPPR